MIPLANLVAFLLVATPIILIPGPSVLFIIGRSLSLGRLGGVLSSLGNGVGSLVLAVAVALGVGTIVAQSVVLFTAVKIAGACYLVYLGIQAIRHRQRSADAATAVVAPARPIRLLIEGFIVGVTNPKTIVFFVAVLPQFVDYRAGAIPLQMLVLAVIFVALAIISDTAWALAAGTARQWFARSPKRLSTMSATGGVLMIGLGVGSLFAGVGKH